ncbi:MAG: hypothetical protein QW775_05665 [Ignisphaera sp.]|uniref:ATPase n=1 Tax=Ignisphaera aggregans TaxID=334771 RepID=A0A7C4JJ69_9CREN
MTRILISGLLVYDSGKTWVGTTLVKKLIEYGAKVGVFKPIAGHNAWSQFAAIIESFSRGLLVGEDVVKYANVVEDMDIAMSNPIDVLLAPPDPQEYIAANVYSYLADLEDQFKQMVLARVSRCSNRLTQHLVFPKNLAKIAHPLRGRIEDLATKLNATVYSVDEFVKLLRKPEIEEELIKCLEIVEKERDIVLIESFNNALTPFRKILSKVDVIIIVTPTRAFIYDDIKEVAKALDEAVALYGERGFESIHVLSKVKPSSLTYIKPRLSLDENDEYLDEIANHIISTK